MWGEFCETYAPSKEKDNMKNTIRELIKEIENKIIGALVGGGCNSGEINEIKFIEYELEGIKKLLFMRSELEDKLYELMEGDKEWRQLN